MKGNIMKCDIVDALQTFSHLARLVCHRKKSKYIFFYYKYTYLNL